MVAEGLLAKVEAREGGRFAEMHTAEMQRRADLGVHSKMAAMDDE